MSSRGSSHHILSAVEYQQVDHTKSGRIKFTTTPYRWLILALFCGLILNLTMATVGFSSYVSQIKLAYGVDQWAVMALIFVPTVLYAPMNFASASFFSRWKIHHTLKLAACMQLIGSWTRALSFIGPEYYWLIAIGSIIFSMANPLILNSISIVANLWFSDDERARATAIAGLMAPIGTLIGLGLAGALSTGVDPDIKSECMSGFHKIVYVQNGFFTFINISFILFFREKPSSPPSRLSLVTRQMSSSGICEDWRKLLKNRNFVLCFLTFTFAWSFYITLGNVLSPLFDQDFNSAQISVIGMIFVLTGAVGCYMMGLFLDKTRRYLFAVRFIPVSMLVTQLIGVYIVP